MRALAKVFEISFALFGVVAIVFLAGAADSAPRPFHERYLHGSLLWGGAALACLAGCFFCKARLKKAPKPGPDTPGKG